MYVLASKQQAFAEVLAKILYIFSQFSSPLFYKEEINPLSASESTVITRL
jgi:hypothetical protein